MEMENINGETAAAIKENISLIKSMDLELILGQMEGSIQGSGSTVSVMDMVKFYPSMDHRKKAYGNRTVV